MSTDAKKHSSIAAGEKPTRLGLANAVFSINDAVNVANATEAGQVAAAAIAAGQVLASDPVIVTRADAQALHQMEITNDGTNWVPASGVLIFSSVSARDTWTTTNSGLLQAGNRCRASGAEYRWSGTLSAWKRIVDRAIFAQVKKSATTAVAAGPAAMIWSTVGSNVDTDSFYTTAQNTRLTAPSDGWYAVSWVAATNSSSSIVTISEVYKNGVGTGYRAPQSAGATSAGATAQGYVLIFLAATDYVEIRNTVSSPAGNWTTDSYFQIEYRGEV